MRTITKILVFLATSPGKNVAGIVSATGASRSSVRDTLSAGRKLGVFIVGGRYHNEWSLSWARIERPSGCNMPPLVLAGMWASIGHTQACVVELQDRLGVSKAKILRALAELREARLLMGGARIAGIQFYKRSVDSKNV